MSSKELTEWLPGLRDEITGFMSTLKKDGPWGRFLPCKHGAILAGLDAELGFSCFAAKIYKSIGAWDRISKNDQQEWLDFIRSFQNTTPPDGFSPDTHPFFDEGLVRHIAPLPPEGIKNRVRRWLAGEKRPSPHQDGILAETKQAIATLADLGATPQHLFGAFPMTPASIHHHLNGLPWSRPWASGARSASLSVFVQAQKGGVHEENRLKLKEAIAHFLASIADPESGAYFRGTPSRGQLVNGAMKVLNALDWLEQPVHYPKPLIDTILQQPPPAAGCHIVDWIFVLHACLKQVSHRRGEIQEECVKVLKTIRKHHHQDGGFSYHPGESQTHYYGAPISQGLDEGDIHATCLLTWAIAMIMEILEIEASGWHVIRA